MAITTLDGWIASGKQFLPFSIGSIGSQTIGNFVSLWKATATYPATPATPSTAVVPTDSDSGLTFTNPSGGQSIYLGRIDAMSSIAGGGQLILYDRLSHMGGLSTTATSSQTVNTATITRGDTNGVGVEGFIEIYTASSTTASTATVGYTDHAGTTRSIAIVTPTARPPGLLIPIPWVGATNGIRSVQTLQLNASFGASGNMGITLARRLATISIPSALANLPVSLDPLGLGLPPIASDACFWWVWITPATATGAISGQIVLGTG